MLETGLRDRVCLVTGAAGDIAGACATILEKEGARLVLTDIVDASENRNGHWVTADLSSREGVASVFDEIRNHFGRLDVVIHCAGVYRVTPFLEVPDSEWDLVMDTNLRSAFMVSQAAIEMMKEHGDGRIVLTGSSAARTGGVASGGVHYTASKAGVAGLARNIANYAGPLGIRINVVNPGFIRTGMSASLGEEAAKAAATKIPLGRIAEPEEPASVAVFLASDLASFVHGATIDVNGGVFMI